MNNIDKQKVLVAVGALLVVLLAGVLANPLARSFTPSGFRFFAVVAIAASGFFFFAEARKRRQAEEARLQAERAAAEERARLEKQEDEALIVASAKRKFIVQINELLSHLRGLDSVSDRPRQMELINDCVGRIVSQLPQAEAQRSLFDDAKIRGELDTAFEQLQAAGLSGDVATIRLRRALAATEATAGTTGMENQAR